MQFPSTDKNSGYNDFFYANFWNRKWITIQISTTVIFKYDSVISVTFVVVLKIIKNNVTVRQGSSGNRISNSDWYVKEKRVLPGQGRGVGVKRKNTWRLWVWATTKSYQWFLVISINRKRSDGWVLCTQLLSPNGGIKCTRTPYAGPSLITLHPENWKSYLG